MSTFGRDVRNVPNLLSVSRIVLVLVAALLYRSGADGTALAIAVLAGLTDYADGAVARATGQVTRLGEILDQVGDLCFESLVLLGMVTAGFLPASVLVAYLLREFWVGGIRRFMASACIDIRSSVWGKVKTNLLMWGALPCYLSFEGAVPALEPYLGGVGRALVGLGLLASYASAVGYTRAFIAGYDRTAG